MGGVAVRAARSVNRHDRLGGSGAHKGGGLQKVWQRICLYDLAASPVASLFATLHVDVKSHYACLIKVNILLVFFLNCLEISISADLGVSEWRNHGGPGGGYAVERALSGGAHLAG